MLFILLFVAIAVAITTLLWTLLPQHLVDPGNYPDERSYADALNDTRAPLGVLSAAVLAAAAAGIGVVVNNHNARLTRESNAVARHNSELTRESIEVTRQALRATERRDEQTHARERSRSEDDRFSKAVEMLGDSAAPVRAGALHILHRLAVDTPARAQLVMDVFCAYLRQPFHHPGLDHDPSSGSGAPALPARTWWPADEAARDRRDEEHEVRRTALRLIQELLPSATPPASAVAADRTDHPQDHARRDLPAPGPAGFRVDLSAAALDALGFTGKLITALHLERAYVAEGLVLDGTQVTGDVRLDGAHIAGDVRVQDGARIGGELRLGDGTHVAGRLVLGVSTFADDQAGVTAEVRSLHLESAHVVGGIYLRPGARVRTAVVVDSTRVGGTVRLDDGAVVDHNVLLRGTTGIAGDLWVGRARVGGSLSIDGPDVCVHGDVRIRYGAELRSGSALSSQVGGSVDVALTDTSGRVDLSAITVAGGVRLHGGSRSGGYLHLDGVRIAGALTIEVGSGSPWWVLMREVHVGGAIGLLTPHIEAFTDVTWSGEGVQQLPRNIEAVELPTGGYSLRLDPSH